MPPANRTRHVPPVHPRHDRRGPLRDRLLPHHADAYRHYALPRAVPGVPPLDAYRYCYYRLPGFAYLKARDVDDIRARLGYRHGTSSKGYECSSVLLGWRKGANWLVWRCTDNYIYELRNLFTAYHINTTLSERRPEWKSSGMKSIVHFDTRSELVLMLLGKCYGSI